MRLQHAAYFAALASVLSVSGCSLLQTSPPPPPQMVTVSAMVPVFTPQAETPSTQEKGGIKITVVPVTYKVQKDMKTVSSETRQEVRRQYTNAGPVDTPVQVTDMTQHPVLKVMPETVQFQVTINNGQTHVFRAAGTVVQFQVNGKQIAVDQSGYGEMTAAIFHPASSRSSASTARR